MKDSREVVFKHEKVLREKREGRHAAINLQSQK